MKVMEIDTVLVEEALGGNRRSLDHLAELVHAPLRSYVFRITLNEDLTDDIVQETIIEMFKIIPQLKEEGAFWPWLCKIALNKIRLQGRTQSRRRQLLAEHARRLADRRSDEEGLAAEISREIRQAIFQSMAALSEPQKAVLSMRCYENMSYAQIAEIMGMTELNCRLMFFRTKKKLRQHLFRNGLGRNAVLAGLVLFGKLTAPSSAAASGIAVTPATLSTGALAAALGLATSGTLLTLVTGGAIIAGTVAVSSRPEAADLSVPSAIQFVHPDWIGSAPAYRVSEGAYFYPLGPDGPVMTRLALRDESGEQTAQVLQNHTGNYTFNHQSRAVVIENHHYWNPDLSVHMLPTDPAALERFVAGAEGRPVQLPTSYRPQANLLISGVRGAGERDFVFSVQSYDALAEERFHHNWPADSRVQDRRDAVHQSGWCRFQIRGTVRNKEVLAHGQMPFTYDSSRMHAPWMELRVDQKPVVGLAPGSLFFGITRPWRGLHVVDTIRRDAARKGIGFETISTADGVSVRCLLPEGTVEYRIDMEKDWIDEVIFRDPAGDVIGELEFEYLPPEPAVLRERGSQAVGRIDRPDTGKHWIFELAKGSEP